MPSYCGYVPSLVLGAILLIAGCSDSKSEIKKAGPSSAAQSKNESELTRDLTAGSEASPKTSEANRTGADDSTSDRVASDGQPSQRSNLQPRSLSSETETIDPNTKPWIDASQLNVTQWELQFLKNAPVGYVRQSYLPTENKDSDRLWIEMENTVWLERDSQRIEQSLQVRSLERVNGRLEKLMVAFKLVRQKSRSTRFELDRTLK